MTLYKKDFIQREYSIFLIRFWGVGAQDADFHYFFKIFDFTKRKKRAHLELFGALNVNAKKAVALSRRRGSER